MKKSFLITVLLTVFAFSFAFSQPLPIKWNRFSDEEVNFQENALTQNADAVILCDYGWMSVVVGGGYIKGLRLTRHKRIKILNESGKDHANIRLPYYSATDFSGITVKRAQVVNFDERGRPDREKLSNDEIFLEKVNDTHSEVRFSFPNVQAGSIIEYEYEQKYHILLPITWYFQDALPTLHSEIRVEIKDYTGLDFKYFVQGTQMTQKYGQQNASRWLLNNLPALDDASFLYNKMDYAEQIHFQLAGAHTSSGSTSYDQSGYTSFWTSWENFANELLETDPFHSYLNKKSFAKEQLSLAGINTGTSTSKMKQIYSYVQNTTKWNGQYRLFNILRIKDVANGLPASGTLINLYLTLLLQEADIEANPVIISTKNNGIVMDAYPMASQFNHVIVHVKIGEKTYLLDATTPYLPYDLLPELCLNNKGYLLDRYTPDWVEIVPPKNSKSTISCEVFVDEHFNDSILSKFQYWDFEALENRTDYFADSTVFLDKFFEDKQVDVLQIDARKAEEFDKSFIVEATLKRASDTDPAAMVYYQPVLFAPFSENPLKGENRYFPLDFAYPRGFNYNAIIHIPDGYDVVEIPETIIRKLPENIADFSYAIEVQDRVVILRSSFSINESSVSSLYFSNLQQLFDIAIEAYNQPVVLEKQQ